MDGHHVAAHARNFPNGKTACRSVAGLTATDIRELADLRDEEVDLLFGGPPCQGFSNMGHRDESDPRNTLVDEFVRIAIELQPRCVVMENVPGMLSGKTRVVLDRALETLGQSYTIANPVQTLNAADFGVPQDRRRVFVIAVRKDVASEIYYPQPLITNAEDRVTVRDAITDLPTVDGNEHLIREDLAKYDKEPISAYAKIARGVEANNRDCSIPRLWDHTKCSGCMRTRHTPKTTELYEATPPGMTVPGHKLPRLHSEQLCPTLRAGSDSSRGSYTSPRPIHPDFPRCITAREAARLHGYPDWFSFVPVKWHAYKQIGNSVCPPVAREIGHQLVDALNLSRTARRPKAVKLKNEFPLPENRPRQKKRIPQMREYPPVIAHLFEQGFDTKTNRLWKSCFKFADVEEAISATGSNLFWVREDTFLQEIARSRNVRNILRTPLSHGFSIRPLDRDGFIGEFVPAAEPDTIDKKDAADVRADDLASAIPVSLPTIVASTFIEHASQFFNDNAVRAAIWSEAVKKIEVLEKANGVAHLNGGSRPLQIRRGTGKTTLSTLVIGSNGNVPQRSRVLRLAQLAQASELVVVTPVSAKHILASRYIRCLSNPSETRRAVFVLGKEVEEGE